MKKPTSLLSMLCLGFCILTSCGDSVQDCTPNDHTICREGVTYWVEGTRLETASAGAIWISRDVRIRAIVFLIALERYAGRMDVVQVVGIVV